MRRPPPSRAVLAFALLASGAAHAQDAQPRREDRPDARENPLLTDRSLEREILERSSRPEPEGALLPSQDPRTTQVVPNQPADPTRLGLTGGVAAWLTGATLIPEGTFLVRRVGQVVRLRLGGLAFLPATQEGELPEPALVLLPCEVYGRVDTLLGQAEGDLWMSLTGEVFEYRGRNYLLPSAFASEAPPVPEQDQTGQTPAPAAPDTAQPADGRIEDLVRELEAQRAERRGIETVFDGGAGDAPESGPRVEGKMLLSRRARMVRSAGGGWAIAIDNDGDSGAGPEGALPERLWLLPCQLVAEMERQAERLGDAWTFQVSGSLHRRGARVYLLPRLFVSEARGEVAPLQ